MMESEKEVWLHAGVEGEGMKTKMGVGEGSTTMAVCTGEILGNGIEERKQSVFYPLCMA
jgi:hypothetical protein